MPSDGLPRLPVPSWTSWGDMQAGGVGVVSSLIGRGLEEGSDLEGLPVSLTCACLSTLKDACRNHEANRDAFLPTSMAKVKHQYG